MAVDLSNRTFLFKETLPVIGGYMSAKFSAKKSSPSGLYFSAMSQIANTLTFQYVPGTSNLTVYNSGWVDNDYRRITFADGVSVSDSLYAWLIQLADEVEDPFLTKTEDLDIVANAIRERSWDYRQLTYPNGYADAISAIGNRVIGGTVLWNQLLINGNFVNSSGWSKRTAADTFTVSDNKATLACGSAETSYLNRLSTAFTFISGHKYFISCEGQSSDVSSLTLAMGGTGAGKTFSFNINSTMSRGYSIRLGANDTALWIYATNGMSVGDAFTVTNVMIIDLTMLLGAPIADALYALEIYSTGLGTGKFMELFPDNYYPYNAGSLLSVAYGEWQQNTPKKLYGVLDLHDDSWVRYGDIYTNRIVYEQMRVRGFIGTPSDWGYNNIHDFFYTTGRPGGFGYYSFFLSFDKIGPCITDAYLYGGSFNAEQTDPTVDPTLLKDGYWMAGWLPSNSTYLIYVKDSSITSDHLNEFTTKNAGKTLIGFTNNRQFVLP